MGMPVIEPVRIDPEYAATALLQSIALEETALSHIINAEGEKLQKGIAISNNVNDLLRLNESVASMISDVKELESALKDKLDAVMNLFNLAQKCRCRN